MRTCLEGSPRTMPEELAAADFLDCPCVYLSAYLFYQPGLLEQAVQLASAAGCRVAMDCGSFEVVRSFRPALLALLEQGRVNVCFWQADGQAIAAAAGWLRRMRRRRCSSQQARGRSGAAAPPSPALLCNLRFVSQQRGRGGGVEWRRRRWRLARGRPGPAGPPLHAGGGHAGGEGLPGA